MEVKQMLILNRIENQDLFERCILKNKIQEKNEITEKDPHLTLKKNADIPHGSDGNGLCLLEDIAIETQSEKNHHHNERLTEIENEKELKEIQLSLEELKDDDYIHLKTMKEIYDENYEIYKDRLKKANFAKDLAIAFYAEYQKIKEKYSFENLSEEAEFEKWF
jgi:hypothetical protein